MIRLWFLFLLAYSLVNFAWAQVDYTLDSPYRKHSEGERAWTLGTATQLYTAPDTGAVLHATLPTATPLIILERLDEAEKRQGFYTNWYRVQYQQQEAFVWGGDLAVTQVQASNSPIQFTYGLQQISTIQYDHYQEPQLFLLLFASQQGQVLDSIVLAAVGTLYTQTQLQIKDNQGLTGIEQVVEIAFNDGYCGGVAATSTLLWDGKKWHALGLLSQGFGDNAFSNQYYKYPQEHKKGSNLIELWKEEGYYNQNQQPVYRIRKKQWYEWTGTQLLSIE